MYGIDPYSGNSIIYRRHDDGWSIYSTGPDGQDDGGRFGSYDKAYDVPGYDIDLDVSAR